MGSGRQLIAAGVVLAGVCALTTIACRSQPEAGSEEGWEQERAEQLEQQGIEAQEHLEGTPDPGEKIDYPGR